MLTVLSGWDETGAIRKQNISTKSPIFWERKKFTFSRHKNGDLLTFNGRKNLDTKVKPGSGVKILPNFQISNF